MFLRNRYKILLVLFLALGLSKTSYATNYSIGGYGYVPNDLDTVDMVSVGGFLRFESPTNSPYFSFIQKVSMGYLETVQEGETSLTKAITLGYDAGLRLYLIPKYFFADVTMSVIGEFATQGVFDPFHDPSDFNLSYGPSFSLGFYIPFSSSVGLEIMGTERILFGIRNSGTPRYSFGGEAALKFSFGEEGRHSFIPPQSKKMRPNMPTKTVEPKKISSTQK